MCSMLNRGVNLLHENAQRHILTLLTRPDHLCLTGSITPQIWLQESTTYYSSSEAIRHVQSTMVIL